VLRTAVGGLVYLAYMAVRRLGMDIAFGEGWIGLSSGGVLIAAGLSRFSDSPSDHIWRLSNRVTGDP